MIDYDVVLHLGSQCGVDISSLIGGIYGTGRIEGPRSQLGGGGKGYAGARRSCGMGD
jgi:hypothetical protein